MTPIVTRETLLTTLQRVGMLGAVSNGYFDALFAAAAVGTPLVIEYSVNGTSGWSRTLNPLTHEFWRWSTDGGATYTPNGIRFKPGAEAIKVGWLSYDNSNRMQAIPANQWTTLKNDGAGPGTTGARFAPDGVTRMLEASTGRILLDQLASGDEVYIRHVVNVIPDTNNLHYQFSHYFGDGIGDRVPSGVRTTLSEGGGVPTNDFLLDSHLFVTDQRVVQEGFMPQVFVSGSATVEYAGCYISVTRR